MIACLDTHYLVWGIQHRARESQRDMIDKASAFLDYLEEQKAKILIPTPVLWEFLNRIPSQRHQEIVGLIQRSWRIAPFDAMAAMIAAELWSGLAPSTPGEPGERTRMKVDLQIIATAIRYGANVVYSEEERMRDYARGRIPVMRMPEIPFQSLLFHERASSGHS